MRLKRRRRMHRRRGGKRGLPEKESSCSRLRHDECLWREYWVSLI